MKRPRSAAVLLLLLALPACRLPRETAAEVNGRPIATAELEAEVRAFTAQFGQLPPALERSLPRVRRAILERLVDRELMLAEAERRGIRPTRAEIDAAAAAAREGMGERELAATLAAAGSEEAAWRAALERDLVIERLQRALTSGVVVTDEEAAGRLGRLREEAALPEEVRAAQILVGTEEEARAARRRILGGEPFEEVARELSVSPDADRGGDLGWFPRGRMPTEFDDAVFDRPVGKVSEVTATPYGFQLFLVTGRRPARAREGAEALSQARAALLAQRREEAFRSWLASARQAAKIRHNTSVAPSP